MMLAFRHAKVKLLGVSFQWKSESFRFNEEKKLYSEASEIYGKSK
jgi:hypothetical protein